ncbi:hypothetical protein BY996DRAFT_6574152 [Phakopsora pachyrhizi]|nr:hypothetical protein BY996DRAFT_6574152 [Phakopsora pachyrhizi]
MEDTGYVALEEAPISRKPSRKDPLRIQVICAAVQEGFLPASALENELRQDSSVDDDDENEGGKGSKDDETIKLAEGCGIVLEAQSLRLLGFSALHAQKWNVEIFIKSSTLPGTISGIETELCPFLDPCKIPNSSPYSAGEVLG